MITQEMLAADAALSGLSEEQRNAILLMSKNDEEVVIGNRFREVYNQLDATIAKETGIARNGDEKTYLYLERAARQLAAKANSVDGLNAKINDLTKERERLQKALEEEDFEVERYDDVALLTIRNYTDELYSKYIKRHNHIVRQVNPESVRVVMHDGELI